jgi:hypothetical protein
MSLTTPLKIKMEKTTTVTNAIVQGSCARQLGRGVSTAECEGESQFEGQDGLHTLDLCDEREKEIKFERYERQFGETELPPPDQFTQSSDGMS